MPFPLFYKNLKSDPGILNNKFDFLYANVALFSNNDDTFEDFIDRNV